VTVTRRNVAGIVVESSAPVLLVEERVQLGV